MTNPRYSSVEAIVAGALALVVGVPAPAPAATALFSDFGPGQSYTYGSGTSAQAPSWAPAVSFVSSASGPVRQIDLALESVYGQTQFNTATVSLWTESFGGLGVELGSWLIPRTDTLTTNGAGHLAQVHGITGVNLTSGQTYFLQVMSTNHNLVEDWFQNSIGTTSAFYLFDGVTYTNTPTPAFDVMAAVPEPAAWTLMLIGFGGLGLLARRRRAAVGSRA